MPRDELKVPSTSHRGGCFIVVGSETNKISLASNMYLRIFPRTKVTLLTLNKRQNWLLVRGYRRSAATEPDVLYKAVSFSLIYFQLSSNRFPRSQATRSEVQPNTSLKETLLGEKGRGISFLSVPSSRLRRLLSMSALRVARSPDTPYRRHGSERTTSQ